VIKSFWRVTQRDRDVIRAKIVVPASQGLGDEELRRRVPSTSMILSLTSGVIPGAPGPSAFGAVTETIRSCI
jgi:hypothetical protein